MKYLWRLLIVVAVLGGLGAGGGFLWLRGSLPQTDGTIALAGPRGPIEIARDRHGVPTIRAGSEHDAFFALGFVHAQDRLWQMDFLRRLGAGRLSEVLGEPTLRSDKLMRTLGLHRLAERQLAALKPETRAAIDAYTAGVNGFLARHQGAWPVEFYLLRYRPEPWRAADSLIWGRLMAVFLSRNAREEALAARIVKRLGAEALDILLPPYPAEAPRSLAGLANPLALGAASNAWTVSGAHTESGKPLLANDPHLRLRIPGLWYLARIETHDRLMAGATVPGVPFHILGHNGHIAWGLTSAETDVEDLFIERIDPRDPGRYLAPGGARRFLTRKETVRVRGGGAAVIEVRATRHGPVTSDIDPALAELAGAGHVIALASPAFLPDANGPDALYALSRARDWTQFRAALADWSLPHLNFTYADRTGSIGLAAPARIPVRRSGDGRLPVPGWTGAHDWTGYIPRDELPVARDPAKGWIVNANNPTPKTDNPHWLGRNRSAGYRARRAEMLLRARARHDPASMTAMQMDTVSLMARDLLPLLSRARPDTETGRKALALMQGWDGRMAADRPQPLIFMEWFSRLQRRLFADELGPLYDSWGGLHPLSVEAALRRLPRWCDDTVTPAPETCDGRIAAALDDAAGALAARHGRDPAGWRWGAAHRARLDHPVMGRIPVIGGLFNRRVQVDGGAATLNRGLMRLDDPDRPFDSVHGAGFRAVYDLADLDASRFVIATGQSGNVLSPHYDDFVARWRTGGFVSLGARPAEATRLRLVPGGARRGAQSAPD